MEYDPNPDYEKSKPWKVSEIGVGGRFEPITRTRTKRQGIEQIKKID